MICSINNRTKTNNTHIFAATALEIAIYFHHGWGCCDSITGCRFKLNQDFLKFACFLEGSHYLIECKHFSKHLEISFWLDPNLISRISMTNSFRVIKKVGNRFLQRKQYLDIKLPFASTLVLCKHQKPNCFVNE